MPSYSFTLILDADPTEEQMDRLYGRYEGDVLSGVSAGVLYFDCHIAAPSFERAVSDIRGVLRSESITILRIELAPDALPEAA